MDSPHLSSEKTLHTYDSPSGSPHIVQGPKSPARSVHAEIELSSQPGDYIIMESLHDQVDPSLRTTDFFDHSSDDDEQVDARINRDYAVHQNHGGLFRRSEGSQTIAPEDLDTRRASMGMRHAGPTLDIPASVPEKLRSGSLLTDVDMGDMSTPQTAGARHEFLQVSGPARLVDYSPRSSAILDPQPQPSQSKADKILGVHAITLEALLRDEGALNARATEPNVQYPARPFNRDSSINENGPPQNTPVTFKDLNDKPKKVFVVPPPIDTTATYHVSPNIVRTPYPSAQKRNPLRRSILPAASHRDGVLRLSIHHHRHTRKTPKVAHMTIPANVDYASMKSELANKKEQHFRTLDYDDAVFLRNLRTEYVKLAGPLRIFSARKLRRITIESCEATQSRECSNVSGSQSDGPQAFGSFLPSQRGLAGPFTEEHLLSHFRNPQQGKARYGWVSWAHRLTCPNHNHNNNSPVPGPPTTIQPLETVAESPATPTPAVLAERKEPTDLRSRYFAGEEAIPASAPTTQLGGLKFVHGWSISRILSALILVLLLAVAAVLLWVFLGSGGSRAGRVGTGTALGIFVLLLGWAGVGAWIWVSWMIW